MSPDLRTSGYGRIPWFTDAQIVAIVRESAAEGVAVEQCAKKHGIPPTLFRWRAYDLIDELLAHR